jgi:hypothetical protein
MTHFSTSELHISVIKRSKIYLKPGSMNSSALMRYGMSNDVLGRDKTSILSIINFSTVLNKLLSSFAI